MKLNFNMPVKVVMGSNCIKENSNLFRSFGKKAMLVTGRSSAKRNGAQKDVTDALEAQGIEYLIFDHVMSNPTVSCVYEGAALAKENLVDFIIAIGGGSPMDAGKAIALLAAQDIPKENLFSGQYGNAVLPMILIPTTAGTGSEVTPYSILTNDSQQTKTSISSPFLFPAVAFLDARYTEALSKETTVNTAIDALSHAIEGMLSVKATVMTNALAVHSMEQIADCFPNLESGDFPIEIREKLLYGSMLAGMVIAHTGTTAVHPMGYSLTYFHDIDHGRANGLLLGEYIEFVAANKPELASTIMKSLHLDSVTEWKNILDRLLGDKETITMEQAECYAEKASKSKNIANCLVKPEYEDLLRMFVKSFDLQK